MKKNRITDIFGIQYPIISGGMVWCSGWRLAAAVSNAGGLGLIGAGSMYPDVLREHIQKCKQATDKPFGVNIPLMYPNVEEVIQIIIDEKVPVVFTSAGNPRTWTKHLQSHGIKVAHVVSSTYFAQKAAESGVDALVAEGFEAGGHLGREETTTLVLIPQVSRAVDLPVIAAGGIATGDAMAATFALGAEGIQIGTRFALTAESSASDAFKERSLNLPEGGTMLVLKKLAPTRLIKNEFYDQVKELEDRGASPEELRELLGRARAKKGIFEGDLVEGELEIGQIASIVKEIEPAGQVVEEIIQEFNQVAERLGGTKF